MTLKAINIPAFFFAVGMWVGSSSSWLSSTQHTKSVKIPGDDPTFNPKSSFQLKSNHNTEKAEAISSESTVSLQEKHKVSILAKSIFARFRPPVVNTVDLKTSETLIQDLGLDPEQKHVVDLAVADLMKQITQVEKANLTVEMNPDGDQFLNIKKYNGKPIIEKFTQSLVGKLDDAQIEVLNAMVDETLTFGLLGRSDIRISASEINSNVPPGSDGEPLLVTYEFHNAKNKLESATFTLSRKAYTERYGPLLR